MPLLKLFQNVHPHVQVNNYDTNNKYKNILVFFVCFVSFLARMLNEDYVIIKREMSFDKV